MTRSEAAVEVFWTAFRVLPRTQRRAVLSRVMEDQQTRRDLLDLATIEGRRHEPVRRLSALARKERSK